MNATESAGLPALRLAADADVSDWIDSLAACECTPDEFIAEIQNRESEDPEAGWEALALLDQQFRREKINHDVFISIKARLQRHSVATARSLLSPQPDALVMPVTASVPAPLATQPPPVMSASPASEGTPVHRRLHMGDLLAGRYRVVDILHSDAAGTLVEALDEYKINLPGIRRRVAIHVMDGNLARSPKLLARLGKLQSLSHPSIARLLDVEEQGGALLLVMELLNGASVRDLLSRNASTPMDITVARKAVRSVASALAYAHSQGVTHGNVDPMNVVINQVGQVFLQGFHLQWANSAEPAADRLAFAWFAYGLLSGSQPSEKGLQRDSRLSAPAAVTREQWRLLRDTLTGKDGAHGDVLAAFSNDAFATGRSQTSGLRSIGWVAGAVLAVIAGFGAFPYLTSERREIRTADTPAALAPAMAAVAAPLAESPPELVEVNIPAITVPRAEQSSVVAAVRPHIDLPFAVTRVETTAPVARIKVRRRGDLDGAVTFQWWTESGSAVPDRDFRRIEPRLGTIPSGANGTEVLVPLMPDAERREARTFYVKIDAPRPRATLGARTLMQVAIVPREYPAQFSTR